MFNVLQLALPVINTVIDGGSGVFSVRNMLGEEVNELGVKQASYGKWYECVGAVQYVQRQMYADMGLDFTKNYINAWGTIIIHGNAIQKQPDQVLYDGYVWNVKTVNEWNVHNGWVNVVAVQDKRYSQ